jgi:pyrroline-5-carboxylate reductase
MVDAGVRQGLQAADAEAMAIQTMAGAAALMGETGTGPADLRRRVTSPGGVTAAGLAAMEARGVRTAFMDAVAAVVEKARS